MDADAPLHVRLQKANPELTLPPENWRFTKRYDHMFELMPMDCDPDDKDAPLFHVVEDPVFAPGNIVAQYYNERGDRDKIEWPMDDPAEIAKFLVLKFGLL